MLHTLILVFFTLVGPPLAVVFVGYAIKPRAQLAFPSPINSWIVAALIAELIGTTISRIDTNYIAGNLLMHAIAGGVATYCMTRFVIGQLRLKLNWLAELLIVIAVVSTLGVANELLEYALEMLTRGRLVFSLDTHDTWRDLAANTVGGLTAFIIYRSIKSQKAR